MADPTIACVDVHYLEEGGANAAAISFVSWDAAAPTKQRVVKIAQVEPYEPGAFYKRELPCLLAVLATLSSMPEIVVVDGHAWLDGGRPGLGAHLLRAEPGIVTVVGVAKTCFHGSSATAVRRGTGQNPLWVDEAGAPVDAPRRIAEMHGPFRVPTLLRLVDRLCRSQPPDDSASGEDEGR